MARTEQITCDVCGTQKQGTNHWFVVGRFGEENIFHIFTTADYLQTVHGSGPMNPPSDCCGEACVLKKVSELISK